MIPLITALAPILGDVVKKAIPDKDAQVQAENAVRLALLENSKQIEASASQIILAEAKSEHWVAAAWRPILMLTITAIVAWNYLLGPLVQAAIGVEILLDLPDEMWNLLLVGVGGYTVGRSAEKVAKTMKS